MTLPFHIMLQEDVFQQSITDVLWTTKKPLLDHSLCILKNLISFSFLFVNFCRKMKVHFTVVPIYWRAYPKNRRIKNLVLPIISALTNGCSFKKESSMNLLWIRNKCCFLWRSDNFGGMFQSGFMTLIYLS